MLRPFTRRVVAVATTLCLAATAANHPSYAADVTGVDIVNHVSTKKVQDTVFVVDTTSSMQDDIDAVKKHARALVREILSNAPDSRIALVEYRDWGDPFVIGSRRSAARTVVNLTRNEDAVISGINGLTVDSGGDMPEDILTGIVEAYRQDWRPGVIRNVIVIGDAPAHNPECATGLTIDDVIAYGQGNELNVNVDNRSHTGLTATTGCQGSPSSSVTPADVAPYQGLPAPDAPTAVSIVPEDEGLSNDHGLTTIVGTTGGTVFDDSGDLGDTLRDVITLLSVRPIVHLQGPGTGKAGRSVKFTTGDNTVYTPGDYTLTIDFGDGTPVETINRAQSGSAGSGSSGDEGTVWHRYDKPGTYTATVTLTDASGAKGTMSRRVVITEADALPADALSAAANVTDPGAAMAGSSDLSASGSSLAGANTKDGAPATGGAASDPVKLVLTLLTIATIIAPIVVNSPAIDPATKAFFQALIRR